MEDRYKYFMDFLNSLILRTIKESDLIRISKLESDSDDWTDEERFEAGGMKADAEIALMAREVLNKISLLGEV
jgi:hypothetical protein